MGLMDSVFGRRKAAPPQLDALFALPNAALTLEAAMGIVPTGRASVSFRAVEGGAFVQLQRDVQDLLGLDGPPVVVKRDDFGFTWLVLAGRESEFQAGLPGLVTDVHAVNASLQDAGFGPQLLCSLVGFRDPSGQSIGLVYLYKQGTFYPFVPTGPNARNNILELEVRDMLAGELPIEPQLNRWMAVWGAPGL